MAETDISQLTTTQLDTKIKDFKVAGEVLDTAETDEFFYHNDKWTEYLGYYKTIPELKKAIDALAIWTVGKGYETDVRTRVILEGLRGQGKDNDDNLLFNLFVMKKVNGDSYAQIIRSERGNPINLKILNPARVRIVYDKNGLIKRYEHFQIDRSWKEIKHQNMLHMINDKIGDEIHGISIIEACKWVIDARNEAMSDWRRLLHRSTIRIIEIDADDTTKLKDLRTEYADAIKKGEVLLVPKGNVGFPNAPINFIDPQQWIQYLENFFYQAVGVPRVIATSENFTEASSKVGYLSFEPIYTREQQIMEADFLNQLGWRIKFNRPPSLAGNIQRDEQKNTGQLGFQKSDVNIGKNEERNA